MDSIINYVTFVFSEIINILDSIKLPGSISLLRYLLSAIIITLIFRIVKSGYGEVESSVNYLNSYSLHSKIAHYRNVNLERKNQLINQKSLENDLL